MHGRATERLREREREIYIYIYIYTVDIAWLRGRRMDIYIYIYNAVGFKMLSKFGPCFFVKILILPAEPSKSRVEMLAILRIKKKMASILTLPWPAF